MYTLASGSKLVTATAIMLLRKRGLLDLDRPINDYLGDAKIRARIGDVSKATVRRVLQHTAGLPGYYETFYPDEPEKPPVMDLVIARHGYTMIPPGEEFYYSNLGYAILGDVVSRVSGKEYPYFIREDLFQPLGMYRAGVVITEALKKHRAIRYRAIRYRSETRRLPDYQSSHPPASDVYASAHDLLRLAMFHNKARLPDQKAPLTEEAIDEMQNSTVPVGDDTYGLGWYIQEDAEGHRLLLGGGGGAGVDARFTLIPEEKVAVVVLANVTSAGLGTAVSDKIGDAIIAVLLGDQGRQTPEANASRSDSPEESGLPGELLGTWGGTVHTYTKDLPVTLWFKEAGEVHAKLSDQMTTLINEARLSDGKFKGKMAGDIGTEDANRRRYYLEWDLRLRSEVLSGMLNVVGHHPSRGVRLPHWVELRRRPADDP